MKCFFIFCAVFFICFTFLLEISQAQVQVRNSWERNYIKLISMLEEARIKYQDGQIIDSHLMVMKAYFDIFENMEIQLRHQFGNALVFIIEGYFSDLREITSKKQSTLNGKKAFLRILNSIKITLRKKIILLDLNKVPI